MTITESILGSYLHDLNVCQHLYTKLDATNADWRPRENMRSTLELMQYLASIGTVTVRHFIENPPKEGAFARYNAQKESYNTMTFEEFPEYIEREKDDLKRLLHGVTDADLTTKMAYYPWNPAAPDVTLFQAVAGTTMKVLATYRHQLFQYAKMCGADIYTSNSWAGMDMPKAPVKETAEADAV